MKLRVRVDDSGGLRDGKLAGRYVLLGVFGPAGRFYRMPQKSSDASGGDYEITVPFDRALPVFVSAPGLVVTDEGGKAVGDSGLSIPVSFASGSAAPSPAVRIRVTGAK